MRHAICHYRMNDTIQDIYVLVVTKIMHRYVRHRRGIFSLFYSKTIQKLFTMHFQLPSYLMIHIMIVKNKISVAKKLYCNYPLCNLG